MNNLHSHCTARSDSEHSYVWQGVGGKREIGRERRGGRRDYVEPEIKMEQERKKEMEYEEEEEKMVEKE